MGTDYNTGWRRHTFLLVAVLAALNAAVQALLATQGIGTPWTWPLAAFLLAGAGANLWKWWALGV